MNIPHGAIFIWTGTNAGIPAEWERVTDLDSKYPKGAAESVDPGDVGGAATHSHTSPAHSHASCQAHTHTISIAAGSGGQSGESRTAGTGDGDTSNHSHSNFTSGAVSGFSTSSVAATYGSVSNDPPFHEVIYVTPTTFASSLPSGIVALADESIDGMDVCDGSGGTPNLVDKYLKGASAAADSGTTGGSTTNVHALSHIHTTTHTHASATSGVASTNQNANSTVAGGSVVQSTHTHAVALAASTPSTTDNVSLTTTETVEPAYTKLLAVQAPSVLPTPKKVIALWIGLLSDIPFGWIICDGSNGTVDMRGRHLKITATVGEVGDTGGSNTHTHAAQNHGHTVAHTHSQSISHSGSGSSNASSITITTSATTHAVTTDSVNLVIDNSSTTADSASNEPPYRTVAFIKLVSGPHPSLLLNFVH